MSFVLWITSFSHFDTPALAFKSAFFAHSSDAVATPSLDLKARGGVLPASSRVMIAAMDL
jgi:hypothetical protein